MQHDVLECFETVLTKGDEARFRLYEVSSALSYCCLIRLVLLLLDLTSNNHCLHL